MPASSGTDQRTHAAAPYRGPDRRGVARFVIRAALPTAVLVVLAVAWLVAARHSKISVSPRTLTELGAIAATLAFMAGVACLLRWRLDGIARGWWCGWALLALGAGQLVLQPISGPSALGAELATVALAMVLVGRAVLGPEVDTTIRASTTLTIVMFGLAVALVPALGVGRSHDRARVGFVILGSAWILLAAVAALRQRRGHHDAEAGWIIPVAVALGLAKLVPLGIGATNTGMFAERWFELSAMSLACVGALGGLVQAAVHHRTRALREHIERERELANRQRVEENFADRLHEMRSTVVALEGGVATWAPDRAEEHESSLRAALIAEIRRLRTLVNESPAATGVAPFDVERALASTIELQRANGQSVMFRVPASAHALGRPAEITQVVHGLLSNAAKYAPGSTVWVTVSHALDEISIRVEDQGRGIDAQYWDRVFERGFRLDPSSRVAGDGLGLAVARKIVRDQDGDLWLEEGPTGGAAFVLSIPAAPALRIVAGRAEGTSVPTSSQRSILPMEEAR